MSKKRLLTGLLAGGLMVGMLPGVASAAELTRELNFTLVCTNGTEAVRATFAFDVGEGAGRSRSPGPGAAIMDFLRGCDAGTFRVEDVFMSFG